MLGEYLGSHLQYLFDYLVLQGMACHSEPPTSGKWNIYFSYPLQLHMHWCACAYHEKLQLALWVKGCSGYKPWQPSAECPSLVWGLHSRTLPSALKGSLGQQWLTKNTESKAPVLKKHIHLLPDWWVEGYFNSHHSTWQRAPRGISHWQKSSWPGLNKNEHQ